MRSAHSAREKKPSRRTTGTPSSPRKVIAVQSGGSRGDNLGSEQAAGGVGGVGSDAAIARRRRIIIIIINK